MTALVLPELRGVFAVRLLYYSVPITEGVT